MTYIIRETHDTTMTVISEPDSELVRLYREKRVPNSSVEFIKINGEKILWWYSFSDDYSSSIEEGLLSRHVTKNRSRRNSTSVALDICTVKSGGPAMSKRVRLIDGQRSKKREGEGVRPRSSWKLGQWFTYSGIHFFQRSIRMVLVPDCFFFCSFKCVCSSSSRNTPRCF